MLGSALNDLDADIVCLQEVQTNTYRRLLIETCRTYPYHSYEPFVHAPKGGLLTLSRHPIQRTRFVLYDVRGLWYTPALADWILHKGVLFTHTQIGDLAVTVMNTHLTANYTGDWSRTNMFARQEWGQLQQLAGLVRQEMPDRLVICAGDFNIPRGSWLSDGFLEQSSMIDPLHGDSRATYRPMPGMAARYAAGIDFNLYRALEQMKDTLQADSAFRFDQKVRDSSGRNLYLSDHNAIELRLKW